MQKLAHGGDITSAKQRISGEILDFSANINPLGLPKAVREVLARSVESFTAYPDPLCRELIAKLAEKEEVPPESISCGNGAADLIFRLVWAIRPRRALLVEPTFLEYRQALCSVGCAVETFVLQARDEFVLTESILKAVSPSMDLVFLCNPNNPTGQVVSPELLMRLLARCAACGALLVIDECFLDFLEPEQQSPMSYFTGNFPNLFILKAFTKIYAMPGLRLGYCICGNRLLMERITACGQAWSVSQPAQLAGIAALEDKTYLEETKEWIHTERYYCKEAFAKFPVKLIGSQANFMFFCLEKALPLEDLLEKYGILIRSCGNFIGLSPLYYRAAVRSHEENLRLFQALEEIFFCRK